MAETLKVTIREAGNKRDAKRLRLAGKVPAVLYGHGEANKSLAVAADEMAAAVRHGSRVVELAGAVQEKALIRELQWDTYGKYVLHVDFARVSEHERIEVQVRVELKGHAVGTKDGGVVEHLVHEIEIECEALAIPDKLEININDLAVDGQLTAADIHLPAGVTLVSDPEAVIVHCVAARSDEELEAAAGTAEPEVIGRKAGEEEEGEE